MEESKIKLLMVEDDKVDQMAFKRLVKHENLPYIFTIAGSVSEAKSIMDSDSFDIVITDYNLGDGIAFDVLKLIKDVPVIVITGAGDEEIAVKLMKEGATDYLIKDPDHNYLKTLPITIENAIKNKDDEQRFSMLSHALMSINDCVWITDLNDNILYVNEALLKIYEHYESDLIGKQIYTIYSNENVSKYIEEIKNSTLKNGWQGEVLSKKKDGKEFPIALSISMVYDHNGFPIALSGVAKDITEQKRYEEELFNTRELALKASRLKSEFVANMSHELRTPLNGILGMTELLLDCTDLTPEQQEFLEIINKSGDNLLSIINDILDFSKIEAGKLEISQLNFKLHDTISDIMKTLSVRNDNGDIELMYYIADSVPNALIGDPGRLRQIIVNLVGNSIKFTEHGEIVVRIEAEKAQQNFSENNDPQIHLLFSIKDTGIGIPDSKKDIIFDSFTQSDGSITRQYGGTGLGLAITKQLVKMMDGNIWFESEEGHGTTFYFTISFQLQKNEKPEEIRIVPENLKNLPVLVVDDNHTNRRILEEILRQWEMKPTCVDKGNVALELMSHRHTNNDPFVLVLLDAQMPEMDGFELAEKIKAIPEHKNVKIMMLSSIGERGDARLCKKLGISSYLTKPIDRNDLYEAIHTILNKASTNLETINENSVPSLVTRHSLRENRQKLHILLAEDNKTNSLLAVQLLKKRGHTVVVVEDGEQALNILEEGNFDLILMDVQMPNMNGFEATKAIRKKEQPSDHIPIIAMTAHAMKGDREACLEAGMDDYISKPIDSKELFRIIESTYSSSGEQINGVQMDSTDHEIFDKKSMLSRLDGDEELANVVIATFLDEAPVLLNKIKNDLELNDANSLQHHAHSLKGAAANIGADILNNTAAQIEQAAQQGNLALANSHFEKIENEYDKLKPIISTSINQDALLQPQEI